MNLHYTNFIWSIPLRKIFNISLIILSIALDFFIKIPLLNAQLMDIIDVPNWQEIPDTGIPNSPEFGNNAYLDRNG